MRYKSSNRPIACQGASGEIDAIDQEGIYKNFILWESPIFDAQSAEESPRRFGLTAFD
jgi:hypothetical protein